MFFSPVTFRLPRLGEERANLSAFRTFVRFVLVWICRFPLPLGVWEGLRFVIVELPGLFSYLFYSLLLCGLFYEAIILCLALFTPGWSPAYLFEIVFVKCVCIRRTSVFFQFYGVLSGVIYNYSPPPPPPPIFLLLLLFKVTLLQQRTVLLVT